MKKMLPFSHAIAIALILAIAPSLSAGPFAGSARPHVDDGTIAGAVFLAADGEKILAVDAVGQADIAAKKPMREDTVFWIASMTKPMTAAAFMMLVDEGKVSLDDPVSKYIPEFSRPQKIVPAKAKAGKNAASDAPAVLRTRAITLRHLLSHTAGLPYSAPEEKPTLDLLPLAKAAGYYAAGDLLFEPGTDYSYANTDINTIGRVIEIVSGMSYEVFLQKRVLDPLGMKETTFWPDAAQLARLATSYKGDPKKRTLTAEPIGLLHPRLDDRERRHAFPGGGLFATAGDVARFGQLLLNKGVFNGKRLLSEAAIAEMTRRQTPPNAKTAYGLGINIQGADRFGHGGAYATYFSVWPKDNLVTVFMVQKISKWGGPDGGKIRPAFEKQARELAHHEIAK